MLGVEWCTGRHKHGEGGRNICNFNILLKVNLKKKLNVQIYILNLYKKTICCGCTLMPSHGRAFFLPRSKGGFGPRLEGAMHMFLTRTRPCVTGFGTSSMIINTTSVLQCANSLFGKNKFASCCLHRAVFP